MDVNGYVMATIPATTKKARCRRLGSSRTSIPLPRCPAAGVKPIVHRGYDGRDLVLPDDPTAVLRLADIAALADQIGHDIVTASGTTLLGADDKAGVAEIVTAAEYLCRIRRFAHGVVRVGVHARRRDRPRREPLRRRAIRLPSAPTRSTAAAAAKLESESFSADAMTLTFHGFNTHPGYAKGRDDQRDQGRSRLHPPAAARALVAGNDGRP